MRPLEAACNMMLSEITANLIVSSHIDTNPCMNMTKSRSDGNDVFIGGAGLDMVNEQCEKPPR